jgi:hypothetical protein
MLSCKASKRSETRSNRLIVSTRTRLATQHGGIRRRFIIWFGDAQDKRVSGAFFWFRFLARARK